MPHRPLLVWSIAAYGAALALMAAAHSVPVLLLAAVIAGTAHGAAFPILSSEVVNRARVTERGSAMATFTSIFDVALLAGAPAVGFLIDGFDYLVGFGAAGLVLVVGAVVYRAWDRRIDPASFVAEDAI